MGNQTTVIIRNDGIDQIRANPAEFVENMLEAIKRVASGLEPNGMDFAAGCHANPARVVECHHADGTVVIAAGGSTAEKIATVYAWRWPSRAKKLFHLAGEVLSEAQKQRMKEEMEGIR